MVNNQSVLGKMTFQIIKNDKMYLWLRQTDPCPESDTV